jgi:hypothetical protein
MGEHHENSLLRPDNSTNSEAVLLTLETQFVAIAAELDRNTNCLRKELGDEAQTKEDEDVLAGAVRKVVGIRLAHCSGNVKVSFQAARSIG